MDYESLPVGFLTVDYSLGYLGECLPHSPKDLLETITTKITNLPTEASLVICSDMAGRPICLGALGMGDSKGTEIDPKRVAQFALLTNAASVIIIHNHPDSGRGNRLRTALTASKEDWACTINLAKALDLFGIHLNDSIIVNCIWENGMRAPAYYSMRNDKRFTALKKELISNARKEQQNAKLSAITQSQRDRIFSGPNITQNSDMDIEKAQALIREENIINAIKSTVSKDISPDTIQEEYIRTIMDFLKKDHITADEAKRVSTRLGLSPSVIESSILNGFER